MYIIILLLWHLPFWYPRRPNSVFYFVMLNPSVHFDHFLSSISCHQFRHGTWCTNKNLQISFEKILYRVNGMLILYMNQVGTKYWLVANWQQKAWNNPNQNKNHSCLCTRLLWNVMILLIFFNSSSDAHYNIWTAENGLKYWLLKLNTYFCAQLHLLIHLPTFQIFCQS